MVQQNGFDRDNQPTGICKHGDVLKCVTHNQRCRFMFTTMDVSLS